MSQDQRDDRPKPANDSVVARAMKGVDTGALRAITAGQASVVARAMKGVDTGALRAITAGQASVVARAMKGIDTGALTAITAGQASVVARAMKGIDTGAFVTFLRDFEVDDEAVIESSAEALQGRPLTSAQWLLWLWLARILAFAAVLNAELQIQEGPASILKTALEVLEALKLGDIATPTAAAAGAGAAFKKFVPARPSASQPAGQDS